MIGKKTFWWLVVGAGAALASISVILAQAADRTPIYLDSKRPVEERIDDLMSRMTLKEKVGQLNLPCVYVNELGKDISSKMEACKKFTAGTYTQEIGPACGFFTLANEILHEGARQQAEYFNDLQKIAQTETRLKIPVMEDEEGTHGAMFPGGTVFPEGLAVGSSFDMDLVQAIYAAAAAEARAVGIHMLSTLVMEVDRDPRMGRNEEAYTEDPYLYMRIGETIVRAAQGSDISAPDKVIAVLTDFPTQSEPASGLERGAIEVSDRSLRENFMPPWIGAITKAGGLGVMAGYPEVEDVPAHASVKWMNDVLRQEIGFKGVVESEGGGFGTLLYEHIVPTQKEAGLLGLRAGVDLNITYEPAYMGPLVESVEEGRVPIELVDRALRRVLEQKFHLGLFENPYVNVDRAVQVVHSQANQDLALRAGREGIVLLKNDKNLLPLKKDLKSVAVIGPNADDVFNQLGDSDQEIPRPPKPQPRYIAAEVLDQLNSHLGNLKAPWMQMVLILQECGMRISELLQLPLDCLTQDARGTFYLRFMQGKMKREHTIPVSQEIARVVQEQQQVVRATGRSTTLLFPNSKGGVIKQQSFAQRINRLAYDHKILDANGKLFRFQSHQFRHTVGTRLINLGVPHHFIQRYLGHLGPEMTNRYAHIHDATMREKLSEYLQGTLVDVTGKVVPEEGPLDTGDLRWFTRNVLAQALPNGYCAIPVVAGPCPHPNACLNCAHFRTDASFLDVHKAELRDTERVITKASANGWTRQIEMNERKRNNLVNIVTSLERTHA